MWDSSTLHEELSLDAQRAVATKLRLTLLPQDVKNVRSDDDLSALFSALTKEGADALFVFPSFVNAKCARGITSFTSANGLTAMYQDTDYTDIGGLISYYTNWLSLRRRAAAYVDKIINGAKPSDLPVEQPATFQLVVNLKAARELGLTIPAAILVRADEVIE